jgi:2-keto-4-pentenoate hydratase/2-oxohepta-3-ene-1,7-dioic acid hydratase in catechol pathway
LLQGRLNGETIQKQTTGDLIHNAAAIISFISRTTTLEPGDVIFTGTPGSTGAIAAGDTVEIELEGVGVLSNPVTAEK